MKRTAFVTVAVAALSLLACSPAPAPAPEAPEGHAAAPVEHGGAAHWSYADEASWGGVCATGATQSPVALAKPAAATDLPDLSVAITAGAGAFLNNGHTLQFTPAAGGTTRIGADEYRIKQFHFHAASEHTLDGKSYPLEVHFVGYDKDEKPAVVGVLFEEGAANPALEALLAAKPAAVGDAAATSPSVDPAALLPTDMSYMAYAGSLTTPPCTEGVRWNVVTTTVKASAEQLAAFAAALGDSNRNTQSLGDRTLAYGK